MDCKVLLANAVLLFVAASAYDGKFLEPSKTWPPKNKVPEVLRPQKWLDHIQDDLLPFWLQREALGSPVGNFPTFRERNGTAIMGTPRYPRMMSRQVYVYCVAFMLTGKVSHLTLAEAGVDWLLSHAWDLQHGGWFTKLDAQGKPDLSDADGHHGRMKTSRDAALIAEGLAAWYFVTRDERAEQALLKTRDMIMEGAFWNETDQRIADAVTLDLSTQIDKHAPDGYALAPMLDTLSSVLLLVQPVLSDRSRREQFLDDMQKLSRIIVDEFFSEGLFWGNEKHKGKWELLQKWPWVSDFGHSMKVLRMLLQVDRRSLGHPFSNFLKQQLPQLATRAYDSSGFWLQGPQNATANYDGAASWWAWAEGDQLAAAWSMLGGHAQRFAEPLLNNTASNWFHFVDTESSARELMPTILSDDSPPSLGTKANEWKNGFCGVQHAVIMYLHGHAQLVSEATLYFAPKWNHHEVQLPPYIFKGRETGRKQGQRVELNRMDHTVFKVTYARFW